MRWLRKAMGFIVLLYLARAAMEVKNLLAAFSLGDKAKFCVKGEP